MYLLKVFPELSDKRHICLANTARGFTGIPDTDWFHLERLNPLFCLLWCWPLLNPAPLYEPNYEFLYSSRLSSTRDDALLAINFNARDSAALHSSDCHNVANRRSGIGITRVDASLISGSRSRAHMYSTLAPTAP